MKRKYFFADNKEENFYNLIYDVVIETLSIKGYPINESIKVSAHNEALKTLERLKADELKRGISSQIQLLFKAKTKKEAIKIGKNVNLTETELSDFIGLADKAGYTHASFQEEFLPECIEKETLPSFIHYEEKRNKIHSPKNHKLTDGELKNIVTQRKNIFVHIFKNKKEWHCIYFTFSDVQGKHWKGRGHVHYVSHLWTVSLDRVKGNLLSKKKHQSLGMHIPIQLHE